MNTFLAALIVLLIIALFGLWLCVVFDAADAAKLWLYKQEEQREIDSEYIENAENEKDRKLSAQLDTEDFFNE